MSESSSPSSVATLSSFRIDETYSALGGSESCGVGGRRGGVGVRPSAVPMATSTATRLQTVQTLGLQPPLTQTAFPSQGVQAAYREGEWLLRRVGRWPRAMLEYSRTAARMPATCGPTLG